MNTTYASTAEKFNDELDRIISITKTKLSIQLGIVMGIYTLIYVIGLLIMKTDFNPVIFFIGLVFCGGIRYKLSTYRWSLTVLEQYDVMINDAIPKALDDIENDFREYDDKSKTCKDIVSYFYYFVELGRLHISDQRISSLVMLYSELFTELCSILERIELTYPDYLGKDEEQMINSMLAFKEHEKAFVEFMSNLVAEIEKEESGNQ
mgnify:FL=1